MEKEGGAEGEEGGGEISMKVASTVSCLPESKVWALNHYVSWRK